MSTVAFVLGLAVVFLVKSSFDDRAEIAELRREIDNLRAQADARRQAEAERHRAEQEAAREIEREARQARAREIVEDLKKRGLDKCDLCGNPLFVTQEMGRPCVRCSDMPKCHRNMTVADWVARSEPKKDPLELTPEEIAKGYRVTTLRG